MKIRSYEDLKVWQKSMELVELIYIATDKFPKKEQYRLVDQLCRAVVSIPSNIAEGSMRHTTKEYIRFVGIAQGSLAEMETQIMIAKRLNYIEESDYSFIMLVASEVGKMLNGLSFSLTNKLQNQYSLATSTDH
jgi:four helix bundle protein